MLVVGIAVILPFAALAEIDSRTVLVIAVGDESAVLEADGAAIVALLYLQAFRKRAVSDIEGMSIVLASVSFPDGRIIGLCRICLGGQDDLSEVLENNRNDCDVPRISVVEIPVLFAVRCDRVNA